MWHLSNHTLCAAHNRACLWCHVTAGLLPVRKRPVPPGSTVWTGRLQISRGSCQWLGIRHWGLWWWPPSLQTVEQINSFNKQSHWPRDCTQHNPWTGQQSLKLSPWFTTMFNPVSHYSPSWAGITHSVPSDHISLRWFLILSSHLCQGVTIVPFSSTYSIKIFMQMFPPLPSPPLPAHLYCFDHFTILAQVQIVDMCG